MGILPEYNPSIYTTNTSGSPEWGSHAHTPPPYTTGTPTWSGVYTKPRGSRLDGVWWDEIIKTGTTKVQKEKTVKEEIKTVVSKRREKRIEKAVDKIEAALSNVPLDDGVVLAWRGKFDGTDKIYQYAAVQAGGKWYITNRTTATSRDELVELLVELELGGQLTGPQMFVS